MATTSLIPASGTLPPDLAIRPREPGVEEGVEVWCRRSLHPLQVFMTAIMTLPVLLSGAWQWIPLMALPLLIVAWRQRRPRVVLTIVGDRLHLPGGTDIYRRDLEGVEAIGTINRELHLRAKGRTYKLDLPPAHAEYLVWWLAAWRFPQLPLPRNPPPR